MKPRVHIVGAGLSGLAAAIRLVKAGTAVTVYEAAGHAGGRCRSFFDEELKCRIDNGNHLLLSGNDAAMAYLADIGASDRLTGPERAQFSFYDFRSGERWVLRPNEGRLPKWILSRSTRIPGTRLRDYVPALKLALAGRNSTVADCVGSRGTAFTRFWEPLTVAILNTEPAAASARLLWPALRETFGRGEAACRPRIAKEGLSETFVDPALITLLAAEGTQLRLNARVRQLEIIAGRIARLHLADREPVSVERGDIVILAVPAAIAARLVPGLTAPEAVRPIVNGHFRLVEPYADWAIVGIVNACTQWVFVRGDVVSVTVSAAVAAASEPAAGLLDRLWVEVAPALRLAGRAPVAARLIKEKQATFAQTPAEVARRPRCRTAFANLMLAGDWTDTGLPATIEGSVRSGNTAARHAHSAIAGA